MNKYKDVFVVTTDTVLGIGVPISKNDGSLIFELKQRPTSKHLIIMIGTIEEARKFNGWNDKAEKLAKKYWPGAVTLVLNKDIALRIPNNKPLREFLAAKGPSYVTSANIHGQEPLSSLEDAKKIFSSVSQFHDFGKGANVPSKIIDVNTGEIYR